MHLRTGTSASFPNDGFSNKANAGFDLPRGPRAPTQNTLIPDARNDENLAVGQTHLAFIRFHNRVVDKLAADGVPAAELFAAARGLVVRHYQWMLRTDFLPRITDKPSSRASSTTAAVVRADPAPSDAPTMPVEFSVAAYRLGHSMVRAAYEWNGVFEDGGGTLEFLFTFSGDERRPRRRQPACRRTGSPTAAASTPSRRRGRTCSRVGTAAATGTSPGASTPGSPTRWPTSRPDRRRGRPDGRAPQPGLPQPDPRPDAPARDRPADGGPHAFQGPDHQDPDHGADPRTATARAPTWRPQRRPARRPREGHARCGSTSCARPS